MRVAVCPGSYDPITLGHLDVVRRAAALFDEVVVAVLVNPRKSGLFTVPERLAMLDEVLRDIPGTRSAAFEGLLVDACRGVGAIALVKGVRTAGDVEYETPMALMNRRLAGVETLLVPADPRYSYVSSSLVKEVAALGGDVDDLLPPSVAARLRDRLAGRG